MALNRYQAAAIAVLGGGTAALGAISPLFLWAYSYASAYTEMYALILAIPIAAIVGPIVWLLAGRYIWRRLAA